MGFSTEMTFLGGVMVKNASFFKKYCNSNKPPIWGLLLFLLTIISCQSYASAATIDKLWLFIKPTLNDVSTGIKTKCNYGTSGCADPNHHTGIDYTFEKDHVVRAVNSGKLEQVESMNGRDHGIGNNVIIKHALSDGKEVFSSYSHLNSINEALKKGENIARGQVIGVIGASGYGFIDYWSYTDSLGVFHHNKHLHLEIKKNFDVAETEEKNAISGSPKKSSSGRRYWGYAPAYPDNYDYYDPTNYYGKIAIIPMPIITSIRPNTDKAGWVWADIKVTLFGYIPKEGDVQIFAHNTNQFVCNAKIEKQGAEYIRASATLSPGKYFFRVRTAKGTTNNRYLFNLN